MTNPSILVFDFNGTNIQFPSRKDIDITALALLAGEDRLGDRPLGLAILAEVVATSALKASEQFTKLIPSLMVIVGYGVAFYLLTIVLRTIPVGIAYAVWAGLGLVLVAIAGAIVYRQIPDLPAIIGMVLIVCGVLTINLFSKVSGH